MSDLVVFGMIHFEFLIGDVKWVLPWYAGQWMKWVGKRQQGFFMDERK
jgi:hypothetical protein